MTTEVFVYGTLKKGGSNHHFLKDARELANRIGIKHIAVDLRNDQD